MRSSRLRSSSRRPLGTREVLVGAAAGQGPPPWLGALLLAAGSAGLDRIGAREGKRDSRLLTASNRSGKEERKTSPVLLACRRLIRKGRERRCGAVFAARRRSFFFSSLDRSFVNDALDGFSGKPANRLMYPCFVRVFAGPDPTRAKHAG